MDQVSGDRQAAQKKALKAHIDATGVVTHALVNRVWSEEEDIYVGSGTNNGSTTTTTTRYYSDISFDADRADGKRVRVRNKKVHGEREEGDFVAVKYSPTDPKSFFLVETSDRIDANLDPALSGSPVPLRLYPAVFGKLGFPDLVGTPMRSGGCLMGMALVCIAFGLFVGASQLLFLEIGGFFMYIVCSGSCSFACKQLVDGQGGYAPTLTGLTPSEYDLNPTDELRAPLGAPAQQTIGAVESWTGPCGHENEATAMFCGGCGAKKPSATGDGGDDMT
jgi:hypothetical protein